MRKLKNCLPLAVPGRKFSFEFCSGYVNKPTPRELSFIHVTLEVKKKTNFKCNWLANHLIGFVCMKRIFFCFVLIQLCWGIIYIQWNLHTSIHLDDIWQLSSHTHVTNTPVKNKNISTFPERPLLLFAVSFHPPALVWLVSSVLEFPFYESPTMYFFVSAFFR